jgi:hypothetical protein
VKALCESMFEDCGKSIQDVEKHEVDVLPGCVSCFGS